MNDSEYKCKSKVEMVKHHSMSFGKQEILIGLGKTFSVLGQSLTVINYGNSHTHNDLVRIFFVSSVFQS